MRSIYLRQDGGIARPVAAGFNYPDHRVDLV
jgi:hypothetical protein